MNPNSYSVWIDDKVKRKQSRELLLQQIPEISILPRRTFVWIPDDIVESCYLCDEPFSWYYRKHHCRWCGRIFCTDCTNYMILVSKLDSSGLIDQDQYLRDCTLENKVNKTKQRICHDCREICKKIRTLSKLIFLLINLPLDITSYYSIRIVNKMWYDACNIILSRFREIQYKLPNVRFTRGEKNMLRNSIDQIGGHNKLISQFIKIFDWNSLSPLEISQLIEKIKRANKLCDCWTLMCCRECQPQLGDPEVLDILLNVNNHSVRQFSLSFLTKNIELLKSYIPILTYSSRFDHISDNFDDNCYVVRDYLINLGLKYIELRYAFYWELEVQLKDSRYEIYYQHAMDLYQSIINTYLGYSELTRLNKGKYLIQ